MVKETWIWSLGGEDPLERVYGNPLQYPCLENPQGQKSLAGYSPWGHKNLDMTDRLSTPILWVGDPIQPSHPVTLFSSCPQSFPDQGLFQWVRCFHRVTKVLKLQHQLFQWIFRIDFSMDWFDLLAVQGTLKSLLASILWYSGFFMVQLSHPYMTAGKTIVLTIWTFVGKVMSLLFNMLIGLVWSKLFLQGTSIF